MISRSAIDLILQFEVGNKNYYNKFFNFYDYTRQQGGEAQNPTHWPAH